ncbi:hypothetical protein K438DRAFT_1994055 [Mycena galopus ATCC 62051]|nr:hypothetical protein K438DRAFT_1994055 [Mycena galopus ATCC 62051]
MSIFFAKPVGDIEAMLRELAPPPHERDFDLDPCVRGHDHCFVLNTGELSGALVASWALRCTGYEDESCAPQYGRHLSDGALLQRLSILRDAYKPRNNALNRLWDTLGDANNLLLPVHELGQCPALPEMAAEKMAKKLEDIKDWLQDMVPDLVPPNPEVLKTPSNNRRKRDLQSKFPLREESPVFSLNSDERDREIHTDGYYPDQDDLDILLPSAGDYVHIVIYAKKGQAPYHARCWTPDPTSFHPSSYSFAIPSVTTKLLVYTITNNRGEYEPVDEPANLVARGKFILYRDSRLLRSACPGVSIWEQRARDWADEQASAPSTQPVPSSKRSIDRGSDPASSGSGSTPADAEAASAEVVVHASGSHGSATRHMGREPGPPTTAEPANAALTKEELYQQKIHAYGYFYQAPLSVSTSDPDYSDAGSSDIEFV